ncbi:hypothetical protein Tco_0932147 [Tanacetum coccineum]
MIPEPGDPDHEVPINETFHEQTDEELTEKELKQVEADDQAIQTILLGLLEEIYGVVDSCETAQEIIRVFKMLEIRMGLSLFRGLLIRMHGNVIAQKEEAGIQLQAEDFDLMVAAGDHDEIKEVSANCILMANLQQASTSKEQYIEKLDPITESHTVHQNNRNVISVESSVEHNGEVAKFVRDFKSLAKEADESLAKHKALEYEIELLLRAVSS